MEKKNRQPVVDTALLKPRIGTIYPVQFAEKCQHREKSVLGNLFDLTQFGVNLTTLPPGQWSALRHWHQNEDEFVFVISGELTLVNDVGEHQLSSGMCAGFPAGEENGHHIVNNSDQPGSYIEIGTRAEAEHAEYPDVDMVADKDEVGFKFKTRNGKLYK